MAQVADADNQLFFSVAAWLVLHGCLFAGQESRCLLAADRDEPQLLLRMIEGSEHFAECFPIFRLEGIADDLQGSEKAFIMNQSLGRKQAHLA